MIDQTYNITLNSKGEKEMEKETQSKQRSFLQIIGPGILYAASAVGVSHLVQATRAGAYYGMGLTLVVILACFFKYPALRFGGDYASATGKNLITNYRTQGWPVFIIYAIAEIFSMVFIVAALSLFTSGLFQVAFGFKVNTVVGVSALLVLVIIMLATGKYNFLEKITKLIVAVFTILIVVSVTLVVPKVEWSLAAFALPSVKPEIVLFIVALIGFMPTPTDASILQSLWTCARSEDSGRMASRKEAALDFNVGYCLSVVLALGFLILGTGVMHSAGVKVVTNNFGFCRQLIALFTQTIGDWSFPIIAVAAICVMLTSLYTVVDGMTRIVVSIFTIAVAKPESSPDTDKLYNIFMIILCTLAVLVLATMMKSFATFMDLTSVIVFIVSPIIAFLNHRAMWSDQVPIDRQPSPLMKIWSIAGVWFLLLLSLAYFYFRFVP